MQRISIPFILLILLGGSGFAVTLHEESFSTLGFTGASTTVVDGMQCAPLEFTPFPGYMGDGNFTLLNLNASFLPQFDPDANVTVSIAGSSQPFAILHHTQLLGVGWFHVSIPANLQTNPTTLNICVSPSKTTQALQVYPQGSIGLYQQPQFDQNGDFETYIAGENPILGREIEVEVKVRNSGSEPGFVQVEYRKYSLDYIPLLKGETGFEEIIQPGETKVISYFIKPLRPTQIFLPPAVLTYINIFGETVTLESTRAYLDVVGPEFNVKGAFLVPQNQAEVGKPIPIEWVVQNEGLTPVQNVRATFFVNPTETISPNQTLIASLDPARAESRSFTVTFSQPGTYEVGCTLTSDNDPTLSAGCQSATIVVVDTNPWLIWVFSALLLLVSLGVYAYIYTQSEKPPAEEKKPKKRFQSE